MPLRAPVARKTKTIQRRAPRQRRALATYEAALEATARIVRREGLAGLNTNRIAEVTGISIGTLYGYFPDKTAIVVALARRMLARDRSDLVAAMDAAGNPVRNIIRTLIAQHRSDRELRRAVMSVHLGEGYGDEHTDGVERFVASLVERGDLAGVGTLRLFIATRAALGVARALVEDSSESRFSDTEIEDEVVTLIENYLGALPDRRSKG